MARETKNWADRLHELVDGGAFPGAIHRLLLWGPPSTGKSTWATKLWPSAERITIHQQMAQEDLIGQMDLIERNGASVTEFCEGPALRAMRRGVPLVLDEIDQIGPDIRCALHAILDDWELCGWTLKSGERVRPKRGFCVVCTCNPSPERLPEALLSRLVCIYCGEPATGATQALKHGYREFSERTYDGLASVSFTPPITLRTIVSVQRLAEKIGLEEASKLILGDEAGRELSQAIAVQESV